MHKRDDGGRAFPRTIVMMGDGTASGIAETHGMSLREYAAIKLRVPDSGIDWLDAMIRQAKRDEFAGQALAGLASCQEAMRAIEKAGDDPGKVLSRTAYHLADALLAERAKAEGGET